MCNKYSDLFEKIPTGLIILEKGNDKYFLKNINQFAKDIFRDDFVEKSKLFKYYSNTINENYSDYKYYKNNLYHILFESEIKEDFIISDKFIYQDELILVKIKRIGEEKFISVENLCQELQQIEKDFLKNLSSKYLLTLSHELKNPMNSLINTIEQIVGVEEKEKKEELLIRIKTNLTFIKFFITNFIFSIKLSIISQKKNELSRSITNSINLEYLIKKTHKKIQDLFINKNSKFDEDFSDLKNVVVNYNFSYFKWFIKNIFIFVYNSIDKNIIIKIKTKTTDQKITLRFKNSDNILNKRSLRKIFTNRVCSSNLMNTQMSSDSVIDNTVKTEDITKEVILTLAKLMKIEINFPTLIDNFYIEFTMNFSKEILSDEDCNIAQELSARESKSTNLSFISNNFKKNKNRKKKVDYKYYITKVKSNDKKILCKKYSNDIVEVREKLKIITKKDSLNKVASHYLNNTIDNFSIKQLESENNEILDEKYVEIISNNNMSDNFINLTEYPHEVFKGNENGSNSDISSNNLTEDEKSRDDVLIVDDEFFNLNVMKFLLKKHKINADTCVDGLECLERLKEKEYKLILMDVMMPEMDGIETTRRIQEMITEKKLRNDLNIVFISASDRENIYERMKKFNVVKEFLSKPVKKEKIKEILDKFYY